MIDTKQHIFKDKEYRVAVVGDVHLTDRSPRSRKDNYFLTTMSEISKIVEFNDIILFLGDIFDTPILAGRSLYSFINFLKYHIKAGKKFYTIIGNHDIYSYNLDSLPKTSLGLLFAVSLIKNLKRIMVHDVIIDGMPFYASLKNVSLPKIRYNKESLLLGHYFYDFNLDEEYSLTDTMIKYMDYSYLLLGHDHKPYKEIQIGNTKLLRGGSTARNSTDYFNLERKPCYYQFVIDKKGIQEINYIEIPNSLPPEQIFIDEAFKKDNDYGSVTDVETILKQFTKKTNVAKYTINNALTDLQTPQHIQEYIKEQYILNNIPFI